MLEVDKTLETWQVALIAGAVIVVAVSAGGFLMVYGRIIFEQTGKDLSFSASWQENCSKSFRILYIWQQIIIR